MGVTWTSSFLCSYLGSCPQCHASCNCAPDSETCQTCVSASAVKDVSSTACQCAGNTGGIDPSHSDCAACHSSCGTCFLANDAGSCKTCSDPYATLPPNTLIGTCECKEGFVPGTSPCTPCAGNCVRCIGPLASDCLAPGMKDFISTISSLYGTELPYETETQNMLCYRNYRPQTPCGGQNPLKEAVGEINNYSQIGFATSDAQQCRKLLKARWLFVTYWFAQLFPQFTGPSLANHHDVLAIKSILQLWILQFGPNTMKTWSEIKAAMNSGGDWANYRATATEFSIDGSNYTPFPSVLATWISGACGGTACPDLKVFNVMRSECDGAECINANSHIHDNYCVELFNRDCGP